MLSRLRIVSGRRFPIGVGLDFAGVVVATGADIDGDHVGYRVGYRVGHRVGHRVGERVGERGTAEA